MKEIARARWPWLFVVAVLAGALAVAVVGDGGPSTPAERSRAIAETIRCPQCQGQSVADSDAPAARAIRTEIARRLEAGQTDEEIRDHIAGLYGEEALLVPPGDGVAGLIWFLPVAGFVIAVGALAVVFRRWSTDAGDGLAPVDEELVARVRSARPRSPGARSAGDAR